MPCTLPPQRGAFCARCGRPTADYKRILCPPCRGRYQMRRGLIAGVTHWEEARTPDADEAVVAEKARRVEIYARQVEEIRTHRRPPRLDYSEPTRLADEPLQSRRA